MKVALFVEGFSELCFTRQLLLNHYNYQDVQIQCSELHSSNLGQTVDSFPDGCVLDGPNCYHIISCSGDAINSRIRDRVQYLAASGFDSVIGLRDIYSQEYDELSLGQIDDGLISNMIIAHQTTVDGFLDSRISCKLCFSRMEIEAWYLGIPQMFERFNPSLGVDVVKQVVENVGSFDDMEGTVYRPTICVKQLFSKIDRTYTKSRDQSWALISQITKEDTMQLYAAQRLPNFNIFFETLDLHNRA